MLEAQLHPLKDYLVKATFIGNKPNPTMFARWLTRLDAKLQRLLMNASNRVENGFFCLKASNKEVVQQVLVLIPLHEMNLLWDFQQWIPKFDLKGNKGMLIPTWIIFKNLLWHYHPMVAKIA